MPAGMFSIDSILSGRPSCKEPLLLHRSGPVVLSAGLTDSIYTDYNGLYSATCGPSPPGIQSVNGTRIGYNGYYYGQLHVQGAGGGPPCCSSVPGLSPQQCPCIPAGYDSPGSVLISPVPHQMMSYMNMGSLSRTELQLLNQLHCRRKRRHRTIFTDEQLEALEGLFQETKYPDVGTREQLARKVHLREEKVESKGLWDGGLGDIRIAEEADMTWRRGGPEPRMLTNLAVMVTESNLEFWRLLQGRRGSGICSTGHQVMRDHM
ncbi:Homeobox protein goosecoid ZGSC [Collichthys lucidus]|uniref:Homeobox protein goosecoid ZGSC n=1 Tax=Collichthys lucidus TaxID=240159 RepID=A0A4U5VGT8_COLLU|nr:Homeobox protein goosecoid ZGSC [Collichthys lucidus]